MVQRGGAAWEGEVEVVAGRDLGLEEGRLAICRLGRGLGGYTAIDEELADGGAIAIAHRYAQGFRGFPDDGGPTQSMHTGTLHKHPQCLPSTSWQLWKIS